MIKSQSPFVHARHRIRSLLPMDPENLCVASASTCPDGTRSTPGVLVGRIGRALVVCKAWRRALPSSTIPGIYLRSPGGRNQ